jgi:hypothetical protein
VAKGYTQVEGEDHGDTFSPTGKPTLLRIIVAMAAKNKWQIEQMDAVAAFLNSNLDEEIYLEQPEGFNDGSGFVWKLKKSIYGLKQLARLWHIEVDKHLKSIGFVKTYGDECVFFRQQHDRTSVIYLHVDNMIITGSNIDNVKSKIKSKWAMEDLGIAKQIVGIEIINTKDRGYQIHQESMIRNILKRFNMTDCKPASTPFAPNTHLVKSTDKESTTFLEDNDCYRSAVGSTMYLAICTCPDIAFAVGVLSRHLSKPNQKHWNAFFHVLRYLKGKKNQSITYQSGNEENITGDQSWDTPECASDTDWARDRSTRQSTTGYIMNFLGGAISWRSRLQQTVALSTTEEEYRATTEAGQEIMWICKLMKELKIIVHLPITLKSNNLSAIYLASNPVFHGRSKHIKIKFHWICKKVKEGLIKLQHCKTTKMIADLFTKNLRQQPFNRLKRLIGLEDRCSH